MKKKILHCVLLLLFFSFCFAEDFLFNSLEGNFTNDVKDPFRYSIYKALDSNQETSFAVPFKNSSSEQFLFMIGTKKVQDVDGIYIANGYCNSSFYDQNYRIKKIRVYFGNANINNCEYEEISLIDTNEIKYYSFSKPHKIKNYITIAAVDLYESSKYDDICITEFGFINKNEILKNKFYLTTGSVNYAQYENLEKSKVFVKNEYVNKELDFSKYTTGSIQDGLIIEKYNYDTNLKKVDIRHYFEAGKIKKTIVAKESFPEISFNYYYLNNKLVSNDFGEYIYLEDKICGFINYNNSEDRNTYCPSFVIKRDSENASFRMELYPADNPGRDGWTATWFN